MHAQGRANWGIVQFGVEENVFGSPAIDAAGRAGEPVAAMGKSIVARAAHGGTREQYHIGEEGAGGSFQHQGFFDGSFAVRATILVAHGTAQGVFAVGQHNALEEALRVFEGDSGVVQYRRLQGNDFVIGQLAVGFQDIERDGSSRLKCLGRALPVGERLRGHGDVDFDFGPFLYLVQIAKAGDIEQKLGRARLSDQRREGRE